MSAHDDDGADGCGSNGPEAETKNEAIAAWNRRAPSGYTAGAEAMREAAATVAAIQALRFDADAGECRTSKAEAECLASAETAGQIAAAIRALPLPTTPASAWRTIDSAPKDGSRFLAWFPPHITSLGHAGICLWHRGNFYHGNFAAPTRWQPMPEPPVDDHG